MKKTIKLIDLDCGHCADKIQNAVKKIDGVTNVSVNFLGQKMVLEAPDDRFDPAGQLGRGNLFAEKLLDELVQKGGA